MSESMVDDIAERVRAAMREADPEVARDAMREAHRRVPDRVDVLHALAVAELRCGNPAEALKAIDQGEALARERQDETSAMMMGQLYLARAAACEDLFDPAAAESAYREVLAHEEGNPRAWYGLTWLLFAWGRTDEALAELEAYARASTDSPDFIEAAQSYARALAEFRERDIHPRRFIEAHRGGYVAFFDEKAEELVAQGWFAEAARMRRDPHGRPVPMIPEGARPYAGERVDLVDPRTGQQGLVGDQPMVVALAEFEPLAQAPVLLPWPRRDHRFPVRISSQCPWNWLPIQVRFEEPVTDAFTALDDTIGDWYRAGFEGAFGSADRGRFHHVAPPERIAQDTVLYQVDCGRAEVRAVDDLLARLRVLDEHHPLAMVVIGRGFAARR